MSARIVKPVSWNPLTPTNIETAAKNTSDMELESFFTNLDPANAIAPLPDLQTKPARKAHAGAAKDQKSRMNPGVPEKWDIKPVQRELLLSQIKRGEECLKQIRNDLAAVRADLEEWPEYERICGRNPLADYLQSISAKEQIAKFLPGWLKRQREQLQSLDCKTGTGSRS